MTDDVREPSKRIGAILRSGTLCEVCLKTQKGFSIYESIIARVESDSFYILPPKKGQMEIPLKPGDVLKIVYQAMDALYEFTTDVREEDKNQSQKLYCLSIPNKGYRIQRRNFFRIKIMQEAKLRLVEEVVDQKQHKLNPVGEMKGCFLHDLSGGGVCVFSNEFVQPDQYFELSFSLPAKEGLKSFQEIVRVVRTEQTKGRGLEEKFTYSMGGYFFSLEDQDRDVIVRYLYKRQLELAHRVR